MNTVDAECVVTLTPGAAEQAKLLLAKETDAPRKGLRVYVEQGGCSGMQYSLVFDEGRDGDVSGEQFGVRVLVDAFSVKYLRGSVLDYVEALSGGGFKLTNPNARESCGCGKSFAT